MSRATFLALALGALLVGTPATLRAEGDVEKGKEVFEQCGMCHHVDKEEKKMGPGLKDLFKKEKMANGKKATDENVMAVINEGGNGMPPYQDLLSDEEKADLMAYLKTL